MHHKGGETDAGRRTEGGGTSTTKDVARVGAAGVNLRQQRNRFSFQIRPVCHADCHDGLSQEAPQIDRKGQQGRDGVAGSESGHTSLAKGLGSRKTCRESVLNF